MSKKPTYGVENGKKCRYVNMDTPKKGKVKKDDSSDDIGDDNVIEDTKNIKKQKSLLVDENDDNETDDSTPKKKKVNGSKKKSIRLSEANEQPVNPASLYVNVNDLKEELKYYDRVPVDELKDLAVGTRVKYVEVIETMMPNGNIARNFKLKPGGVIIVNGGEYLVLASGNRKTWSVQLSKHIIFLEKFEQVRAEYEKKIKEYERDLKRMKESNKNIKNENSMLKKKLMAFEDKQ